MSFLVSSIAVAPFRAMHQVFAQGPTTWFRDPERDGYECWLPFFSNSRAMVISSTAQKSISRWWHAIHETQDTSMTSLGSAGFMCEESKPWFLIVWSDRVISACYDIMLLSEQSPEALWILGGENLQSSFSDILSFSRAASSMDSPSAMVHLPPLHVQGNEKKSPANKCMVRVGVST